MGREVQRLERGKLKRGKSVDVKCDQNQGDYGYTQDGYTQISFGTPPQKATYTCAARNYRSNYFALKTYGAGLTGCTERLACTLPTLKAGETENPAGYEYVNEDTLEPGSTRNIRCASGYTGQIDGTWSYSTVVDSVSCNAENVAADSLGATNSVSGCHLLVPCSLPDLTVGGTVAGYLYYGGTSGNEYASSGTSESEGTYSNTLERDEDVKIKCDMAHSPRDTQRTIAGKDNDTFSAPSSTLTGTSSRLLMADSRLSVMPRTASRRAQ